MSGKVNLIQTLRQQFGWSQQQLAKASGLSTRTIQRIESGHSPSVESIKSLAAVFELNFGDLRAAMIETADSGGKTATLKTTQLLDEVYLRRDKARAIAKIKRIKLYCLRCLLFALFLCVDMAFLISDAAFYQTMFPFLVVILVIDGLSVFDCWPFSVGWEERRLAKMLRSFQNK